MIKANVLSVSNLTNHIKALNEERKRRVDEIKQKKQQAPRQDSDEDDWDLEVLTCKDSEWDPVKGRVTLRTTLKRLKQFFDDHFKLGKEGQLVFDILVKEVYIDIQRSEEEEKKDSLESQINILEAEIKAKQGNIDYVDDDDPFAIMVEQVEDPRVVELQNKKAEIMQQMTFLQDLSPLFHDVHTFCVKAYVGMNFEVVKEGILKIVGSQIKTFIMSGFKLKEDQFQYLL